MVEKKLAAYRAKRNFKKTTEPSGEGSRRSGKKALRFCVQKHQASHLHYDFRLEHHAVLLSWAVPKGPSLRPGDKRLAMKVEDHPLDYRTFEGVIPEGYGAGIVMLWDEGTWLPQAKNVDLALKKGNLKFSLDGTKLKGSWALIRIKPQSNSEKIDAGRNLLLIKHADEWSGDVDVVEAAPLSVKSFSDFADILAANPKKWISHGPASGRRSNTVSKKTAVRKSRESSGPKPTPKPK